MLTRMTQSQSNDSSHEAPTYTHDCSSCQHLGAHASHDLYYCDSGAHEDGLPAIVARYGSKPEERLELPVLLVQSLSTARPIRNAYARAVAQGLISA